MVLVRSRLTTPFEVVIIGDFKHIWHQVVTLNDQVLDDGIDHGVGDLDARDGHISGVLEDARNDHVDKVFHQVRLECGLSILVRAKIIEELVHGIGKGLILWVLVELVAHELELVHDAVGMVFVAVAEQEVPLVIEGIPLIGRLVLENVALFLEASADVLVHGFEPILQLWVLVGIAVQLIDGVEEVVRGSRVGKTLDESLEFCQRVFVIADST